MLCIFPFCVNAFAFPMRYVSEVFRICFLDGYVDDVPLQRNLRAMVLKHCAPMRAMCFHHDVWLATDLIALF
jgi:hypothetical protein